MTRHVWLLWLTPLVCWGVYLCWLSGYQNGYRAGHDDGWDTAVRSLGPATAAAEIAVPTSDLRR